MKTYTTKKGVKGIALGINELPPKAKAAYEALKVAKAAFKNALCADIGQKPDAVQVSQQGFTVFISAAEAKPANDKPANLKDAFAGLAA